MIESSDTLHNYRFPRNVTSVEAVNPVEDSAVVSPGDMFRCFMTMKVNCISQSEACHQNTGKTPPSLRSDFLTREEREGVICYSLQIN